MVKVQKPIPKTIKKGDPDLKKGQTKIAKTKSTKEVAKKVKKTLAVVDAIKVENVGTKSSGANKKKNELLDKLKETVVKKKPFVQKSVKNGLAKQIQALQEVSHPLEKIESKKKTAVAKKQPLQNFAMINSALDEEPATTKKPVPKKKPVEAKVQQLAKKSIVKKTSVLKEVFENDKKVILKKKQVVDKVKQPGKAKVQQAKKTPVALEEESEKDKKVILMKKQVIEKMKQPVKAKLQQTDKTHVALEEESEEDKKIILKKKQFVAKVQQPVKAKVQQAAKKIAAKKNSALDIKLEEDRKELPKKKIVVAKEQQPAKKSVTEIDLTGKEALQKKSNSKVQKKLSVEKKNEINLKNKVRKNVREVKKILHNKDQDEIVEFQKKKSPIFEPENFNEDKFKNIVSLENIKKIFDALKVLVGREVLRMRNSVFGDYALFLNVACYKIPNCPKRMVKLNLKHSLVDIEIDDVVLIVPDLQRGAEVDYEPTIQHYDDILRQHGLQDIKVLPLNQLRNEYKSYEAKRKLSNIYDYFLCDARIVGQVVGFCGKNFQKPRTTIHAVNMSNPGKKIKCALKRTAYRQLLKGDLSSVLVGNHRFTAEQLAENIEKVIHQLKTVFPGGHANIRSIHLRIDIPGTSSLPLYVNLAGPPDDVPNVIGPREQRMLKLKKQANDVLSKFSMTKTGDFVKLNKAQVKRKQEIHETREALASMEHIKVDEAVELNPPSKKKSKTQNSDESEVSDSDNVNGEDDEVSEEDVQVSEGEEEDEDGEGSEEDDEDGEGSEDDDE